MTDMNTRTEATKLCKKCGRELTLDHFGKKNGAKDGLQNWCKECMTKNVLEARRAKKAAKAQTETEKEKEPKPIFNPIIAVEDIPDQTLADELRHRGWDVKATRPKTIIEEL